MIKESILRVLSLIKKEFITIWEDPKSRRLIMAIPLLQLFIFANAITMEVRNIDVVVLDKSHSVESRDLLSRFEHSPRFRKFYYIETEKEFKNKIDTQKVQIGLYINNDFARDVRNKKGAYVQIIADGRQTNSAAIASSYAGQIISQYNNELSGIKKVSITPSVRNWFNPNLEYRWFLLTILVSLLALVITLILTALSIAREREVGTFEQLIVSPLSSFEVLLGKTIPSLVIALSLSCFMASIVIFIFKVPFEGSFLLFFIAMAISLLSIVGVGLFISSICKTQQQAILGVITFQMPAVLLSGFISPIEDMPEFFQTLTWINPIRFFIKVSKGIFLKGMGAEDVFLNLIPLMIIATITLTAASLMFKKNLD